MNFEIESTLSPGDLRRQFLDTLMLGVEMKGGGGSGGGSGGGGGTSTSTSSFNTSSDTGFANTGSQHTSGFTSGQSGNYGGAFSGGGSGGGGGGGGGGWSSSDSFNSSFTSSSNFGSNDYTSSFTSGDIGNYSSNFSSSFSDSGWSASLADYTTDIFSESYDGLSIPDSFTSDFGFGSDYQGQGIPTLSDGTTDWSQALSFEGTGIPTNPDGTTNWSQAWSTDNTIADSDRPAYDPNWTVQEAYQAGWRGWSVFGSEYSGGNIGDPDSPASIAYRKQQISAGLSESEAQKAWKNYITERGYTDYSKSQQASQSFIGGLTSGIRNFLSGVTDYFSPEANQQRMLDRAIKEQVAQYGENWRTENPALKNLNEGTLVDALIGDMTGTPGIDAASLVAGFFGVKALPSLLSGLGNLATPTAWTGLAGLGAAGLGKSWDSITNIGDVMSMGDQTKQYVGYVKSAIEQLAGSRDEAQANWDAKYKSIMDSFDPDSPQVEWANNPENYEKFMDSEKVDRLAQIFGKDSKEEGVFGRMRENLWNILGKDTDDPERADYLNKLLANAEEGFPALGQLKEQAELGQSLPLGLRRFDDPDMIGFTDILAGIGRGIQGQDAGWGDTADAMRSLDPENMANEGIPGFHRGELFSQIGGEFFYGGLNKALAESMKTQFGDNWARTMTMDQLVQGIQNIDQSELATKEVNKLKGLAERFVKGGQVRPEKPLVDLFNYTKFQAANLLGLGDTREVQGTGSLLRGTTNRSRGNQLGSFTRDREGSPLPLQNLGTFTADDVNRSGSASRAMAELSALWEGQAERDEEYQKEIDRIVSGQTFYTQELRNISTDKTAYDEEIERIAADRDLWAAELEKVTKDKEKYEAEWTRASEWKSDFEKRVDDFLKDYEPIEGPLGVMSYYGVWSPPGYSGGRNRGARRLEGQPYDWEYYKDFDPNVREIFKQRGEIDEHLEMLSGEKQKIDDYFTKATDTHSELSKYYDTSVAARNQLNLYGEQITQHSAALNQYDIDYRRRRRENMEYRRTATINYQQQISDFQNTGVEGIRTNRGFYNSFINRRREFSPRGSFNRDEWRIQNLNV